MLKIRTTKTKSQATAVQVVLRTNHQTKIVKHIGSAHSEQAIEELQQLAYNWIEHNNPQLSLLAQKAPTPHLVSVDQLELIKTTPILIHTLCMQTLALFGFDKLLSQLLLDIVFMRLVEPASKVASIQLLASDFSINHSLRTLNRKLKTITDNKTAIEVLAAKYARQQLDFDFRVVFYDVTTLYYESFKADDIGAGIKLPGFSKDNKHQQPQIVLGLVVTKEGFPIEFKTFAGNKFEGHTLLPTLEQLQHRHKIKHLTVVADAAMLSKANIKKLREKGIGYIVGARLANLSQAMLTAIDQKLERTDQATIRLKSQNYGWLICQFSKKRYAKDKHETTKQVEKARRNLNQPSKAIKRLKFIQKDKSQEKLQFNEKLLEKTKKLWGIKGYYSDQTETDNQAIIEQYHNLWQVEKAFRISKSDLQTRPIYHRKTQHIVAHLLICFMALCVAKHWERATGLSIKKIVKLLRNIHDAEFRDNLTGNTFTLRRKISDQEKSIVEKLS